MKKVAAASSLIPVNLITGNCYDYQSGTRKHHRDVVMFTHELQSLRNVLERLGDIANS